LRQADAGQFSQQQAKRLIAAVLALEAIAFTGGITVAPLIIEGMVADKAATSAVLGAYLAIGAFVAFIASPVLGSLSDAYGRRPVLIWSLVCATAANVILALAPTISVFFFGRIISGLAGATMATCYAYASDITQDDERTGIFGFLGAVFGLGLIAGPAVGGILGEWNDRTPFLAAAVLCAASTTFVIARLPESLPPKLRTPFSWANANPAGSFALLIRRPRLWRGSVLYFLMQNATNVVLAMFVLYTTDRYGWSGLSAGLAMAATGVLRAVVQVVLVERLSTRSGDRATIILGLGFGVVGFSIWSFAPTGAFFLTGIPFVALLSLSSPSVMSIMTRDVSPSEQGQLQGALNAISAVAGVTAPFLFGAIYAFVAAKHPPVALQGAPFLMGALVLLVAAGIAAYLSPRTQLAAGNAP
jgi:DHA1 family tetracycline resistance protein-like MFS transporter